MATNISFLDIQNFLSLIYEDTPADKLAQYHEPGAYNFPKGNFEWGHSTGKTRVFIKVDITNDPVVFTWPPLKNQGILLETSSNDFKVIDKGGNHIRNVSDKKTRDNGGYRVPGDAVAVVNARVGRVQSVTLFTSKYYVFLKYRYL